MPRAAQGALVLALLAGFTAAHAQTGTTPTPPPIPSVAGTEPDVKVRALIPDVITIRSPNAPLAFDIGTKNYPPEKFPYTYYSAVRPVAVYSNAQGSWNLQLNVEDILDKQGAKLIPASQFAYRINQGPWIQGGTGPQVIYAQNGPTSDWLNLDLEFSLTLNGTEQGGDYGANITFTALRLP